jgi:hypothetical protein
MTWVAVAVAGGAIVGGVMSSSAQRDAASTAANAQTQAAQLGVNEQSREFDNVRQLLNPYVNAAVNNGQYTPLTKNDLVDTSSGDWKPNATLYANSPEYRNAWDQFYAGHMQQFGVAPNLNRGSGLQVTQDQLANGLNLDAYNAQQQQAWNAQPHTKGSLSGQQDLLGLNGAEAQQAAISGIQNSPLFAALSQQGENGILQNASATGGLRGGNVQGALAQFRPQMLSALIDQQYSRLGGLTSLGQNAAAGVGNAGIQTGNQITGLLQQQGAAAAGAALAGGRADAGMINSITGGIGTVMGGFKGLGSPSTTAGPAYDPGALYNDNTSAGGF